MTGLHVQRCYASLHVFFFPKLKIKEHLIPNNTQGSMQKVIAQLGLV